jgi:formylglycine-generating enzyme required for sulfatase activity
MLLADLPGRILIHSSVGAEVFLDSASRGRTDASGELALADVPRGAHEVRISAPGKKEYRQNITVPAGQEAKIDAPLADLGPAPAPLRVRENPKDGLKYVWIPPGTFQMGCSPGDSECSYYEKPAHQVRITKGFWIGQTEVTVGAYKRFASATGRGMRDSPDFNSGWSNEQMPIVNVSWNDAQAYCAWAEGRLSTEAEWEYAARAGSTEARYGPIDEVAWWDNNSGQKTHEVGQKRANGFGLFDMLGNVFEWVNDWDDENYYENSPSQDPAGATSGEYRVLRGGSLSNNLEVVRVSVRLRVTPGYRRDLVGFRCGGEVFAP